jgi:hypothetical protein
MLRSVPRRPRRPQTLQRKRLRAKGLSGRKLICDKLSAKCVVLARGLELLKHRQKHRLSNRRPRRLSRSQPRRQ